MTDFTSQPHVIMVNESDQSMGICEKVHAHKISVLHRAVSVYLKCGDQVLLQKRSLTKYHGGGLWTNAACTHPMHGESNEQAAQRALQTEIGITANLRYLGYFIYKENVGDLIEHELDHTFIGEIPEDTSFKLNPDEVSAVKFVGEQEIAENLLNSPQQFTPWFPHVFRFIKNS